MKNSTANDIKTARIFVPVDPLNSYETEIVASINGTDYPVPLGKLVELPENVCQLLVSSRRADNYELI